jgi:hypothetical protein
MAARADRGELLAVTDRYQLRAGLIDEPGEGVQAAMIGHSGLVQEHGRVRADPRGPRLGTGDESVDRRGAARKRRCGFSESLCR